MQDRTMALARRDFEMGYLKDWRIERSPLQNGWNIYLYGTGVSSRGPLVDSRTKQPRLFKTLEAAISILEEIGFQVLAIGRV